MQLNKLKIFKRGFTLLELLVVVAIIGILSAIVLTSIATSRAKSFDSYIQQNLRTVQTQAEIYFQSNKKYASETVSGTCHALRVYYNTMFRLDPVINKAILGALNKTNNFNYAGTSFCGVSTLTKSWVAGIRLKSSSTSNSSTDRTWCVDSSLQSKVIVGPAFNFVDDNTPPTYKCP